MREFDRDAVLTCLDGHRLIQLSLTHGRSGFIRIDGLVTRSLHRLDYDLRQIHGQRNLFLTAYKFSLHRLRPSSNRVYPARKTTRPRQLGPTELPEYDRVYHFGSHCLRRDPGNHPNLQRKPTGSRWPPGSVPYRIPTAGEFDHFPRYITISKAVNGRTIPFGKR